ncbi:MAG: CHAT domain-containing protein [Bacteroidota bacterium]
MRKLISSGRYEQALDVLEQHPLYASDHKFSHQVTMQKSAYNALIDDKMSNLISPEDAARREAGIVNNMLKLLRLFSETSAIDTGTTTTPAPAVEAQPPAADVPTILFLASHPMNMGKLQLEKEYVKIQTQLGDKVREFNLKIKFEPRADTLTKTMLDERPTYVHFAGHGVGETDGFNPAGIVLEDRQGNPNVVPGAALANMFRLLKRRFDIKVVVLNACESVDHAKAISTNAIYTVGMTDEIPDRMAISFAGGFYLGISESPDDIPFAFEMALNNLLMEGIEGHLVPKLFLDGEEVEF